MYGKSSRDTSLLHGKLPSAQGVPESACALASGWV